MDYFDSYTEQTLQSQDFLLFFIQNVIMEVKVNDGAQIMSRIGVKQANPSRCLRLRRIIYEWHKNDVLV